MKKTEQKKTLKTYTVCPFAGSQVEKIKADSHESQPGYLALRVNGETVAIFWGMSWFRIE